MKKQCENCGKEHDGSYGSGRFCSESCKQQYNVIPKTNKHYCCKFCGREFSKPTSLGAHVSNCKQNPNFAKTRAKTSKTRLNNARQQNPLITIKLKCENCGKIFQQTITQKEFERKTFHKCCSQICAHSFAAKNVSMETRRQVIKKLVQTRRLFGLYKRAKPKRRFCEACGKPIIDVQFKHSKYCSVDCRVSKRHEKLSHAAKTTGFAGYNEAYKKAKRGWYKGFWCGSSWELAFLLWALDHKLNIKRCDKVLKYEFEGKLRRYYPDFEIDDIIYEIKGYEDKFAKAKQQAFPNVVVLKYAEMKDKIEYVKNTYGNEFVNLLESKQV